VVVVDVAFAAENQFRSKTRPFLDALGDRLVCYVDHHEHREAWPAFADNPRFILVPNKLAHACPELITPEVVERAEAERGRPDAIVAHCDFDGALSAVKWQLGGKEPWPGADEDARAVDTPGRGHRLSDVGARIAWAMDEASVIYDKKRRLEFMSRITAAIKAGEEPLGLASEVDDLAAKARDAEQQAAELAKARGREEAPGVFVVRVDEAIDNRTRRNLLLEAETVARVGAVISPDPDGGAWIVAATFDESLDLEDVPGFSGGRSDYRFTRAHRGGKEQVAALGAYVASRP